jgi:hypothetical protein
MSPSETSIKRNTSSKTPISPVLTGRYRSLLTLTKDVALRSFVGFFELQTMAKGERMRTDQDGTGTGRWDATNERPFLDNALFPNPYCI